MTHDVSSGSVTYSAVLRPCDLAETVGVLLPLIRSWKNTPEMGGLREW